MKNKSNSHKMPWSLGGSYKGLYGSQTKAVIEDKKMSWIKHMQHWRRTTATTKATDRHVS